MYTVFFRELIVEQTDPDTGYEVDPNTGLLIDADNGLLFDPQSGNYYNPQNMQLTDPATGEALDPETGEPLPNQDPPPEQPTNATSEAPDPNSTASTQDPNAEDMLASQDQQVNNESIDNVERYIIYSKLLNLKYSLENSSIPNKDPKELNDVIYHMTILLTFFDSFTKDQIVEIATFLTSRINSLLNVQEQNKK